MSLALINYSTEDLEYEIQHRRNEKLYAWRAANVARSSKISSAIVDFIAPVHSGKCGDFVSLTTSGISHCNRCSLTAMGNNPQGFEDVQLCLTVDFNLTKQMSFK